MDTARFWSDDPIGNFSADFRAPAKIEAFLDGLRSQMLVSPNHIEVRAPDPDDLIFIEAALATAAQTVVTGNIADFPSNIRHGVHILTPADA